MYTIELNIKELDNRLIEAMRGIGTNNGFDIFNHGKDQLVFASDRGVNITKLIDELNRVCESYSVDYMRLLI